MKNIQVITCDQHHIERIKLLAEKVWKPTFAEILSEDRLVYLFNLMYDEKTLENLFLDKRNSFFLLNDGQKDLGYAQLVDKTTFFKLEKLYISPDEQSKGYGLYFINFIVRLSQSLNGNYLHLQVNRGNTKAIDFYKRFGFSILRSEDFDVGNGHVMDDFVMSYSLR